MGDELNPKLPNREVLNVGSIHNKSPNSVFFLFIKYIHPDFRGEGLLFFVFLLRKRIEMPYSGICMHSNADQIKSRPPA